MQILNDLSELLNTYNPGDDNLKLGVNNQEFIAKISAVSKVPSNEEFDINQILCLNIYYLPSYSPDFNPIEKSGDT